MFSRSFSAASGAQPAPGREEMERGPLIDFDEDDTVNSSEDGSLSRVTAAAMQSAKVREMLDAFRTEGPEALSRFVDDPSYSASLEILRGSAGRLPVVGAPPVVMPTATATIISPMVVNEDQMLFPKEVIISAAPVVAEKLQSESVRKMLEAFRRDGPSALNDFVNDPECVAAVEQLRGANSRPSVAVVEQRVTAVDLGGRKPRVLLACSGSVATLKAPALALAIREFAHVDLLLSRNADFFFTKSATYDPASLREFEATDTAVYRDADEWTEWRKVGDPVVHMDLARSADLLLVAPLGANSLAKLSNGICDDLLTSVARAWEVGRKPMILAPAMNTAMWSHPITAKQLSSLQELGAKVVPPVSKLLACGDTGVGALADIADIVAAVKAELRLGPR